MCLRPRSLTLTGRSAGALKPRSRQRAHRGQHRAPRGGRSARLGHGDARRRPEQLDLITRPGGATAGTAAARCTGPGRRCQQTRRTPAPRGGKPALGLEAAVGGGPPIWKDPPMLPSEFTTIALALDPSGLARLELRRVDAANAIDPTMARELRQAVVSLLHEPAVRAVLITGAGPVFCGGGDLASFAEVPAERLG